MDTDTVDLPQIDEALLKQLPGAVVVRDPDDKLDLAKVDLTAAALARFGDWKARIKGVRDTLTGVVHDLSTQAKVDEAKSLRWRLIGQPRADARATAKALKSTLNKVSKAVGTEEEAVVKAYDEAEELITPQITKRQDELDAEREAKAAKERERVAGLEAKVAGLGFWIERCKEPGITAERIANGIKILNGWEPDPAEWQDYLDRAKARRAEVIDVMRQIHSDTLAAEMRAAELERQRQENERVAAELAAQRAEIERQAAELEARRAEDARVAELAAQRERDAAAESARVAAAVPDPFAQARQVHQEIGEQVLAIVQEDLEQNSQRQVSGAQTDPNATGNGNMAHQTDDAAPVGGLAEGEGATALSPGSAAALDGRTDEEPPPPGGPEPDYDALEAELVDGPVYEHPREGSGAGTPATCASSAVESATAAPSGDEGPAAHADDSAADPDQRIYGPPGLRFAEPSDNTVGTFAVAAIDDGLPLETSEREAQSAIVRSGFRTPAQQALLDHAANRRVTFEGPEPEEEDEGGIDLLLECLGLVEVLRTPYAGRFPSHPKPGPEWWADVRSRLDQLEPKLVLAAALKRGA